MRKVTMIIALPALILFALSSFAVERQGNPYRPTASPSKTSENVDSIATSVFEQVSKSVVIVEALSSVGSVQGSGVAFHNNRSAPANIGAIPVDRFTYIVSNAHVVKNASSVYVLQGDKRLLADIEYVDDEFDLALLAVKGALLPITFPYSGAELQIGEKVFAIGSPLGLENTISEGIISGKRDQNGVLFLQTTAPISKGSSGGGLFNAMGHLVGITTFKLVGGENLNFAVDAGLAQKIASAWMAAGFLRVVAEGHFSAPERAIINSDSLIKWIVMRSLKNDGLSEYLIKKWEKVDEKSIEGIEKEVIPIVEQFVKEQDSMSYDTRSKPDIMTINCTVADREGKHQLETSLKIDYKNKTVNGLAAHFSDAEVRWTTGKGFEYVLNRYSGRLRIGKGDFLSVYSGQCSRVTEKKF